MKLFLNICAIGCFITSLIIFFLRIDTIIGFLILILGWQFMIASKLED